MEGTGDDDGDDDGDADANMHVSFEEMQPLIDQAFRALRGSIDVSAKETMQGLARRLEPYLEERERTWLLLALEHLTKDEMTLFRVLRPMDARANLQFLVDGDFEGYFERMGRLGGRLADGGVPFSAVATTFFLEGEATTPIATRIYPSAPTLQVVLSAMDRFYQHTLGVVATAYSASLQGQVSREGGRAQESQDLLAAMMAAASKVGERYGIQELLVRDIMAEAFRIFGRIRGAGEEMQPESSTDLGEALRIHRASMACEGLAEEDTVRSEVEPGQVGVTVHCTGFLAKACILMNREGVKPICPRALRAVHRLNAWLRLPLEYQIEKREPYVECVLHLRSLYEGPGSREGLKGSNPS